LNGSLWDNHEKDQLEYRDALKISGDSFNEMKKIVRELFERNKLDNDGRFVNCADAVDFLNKYLHNLTGLKIIALALDDEYKNILCDEVRSSSNICSTLEVPQQVGGLIGYEILGWDCGGFHSYLCNGFDKDISEQFKLMVNEFGVIQNAYAEVKEFAEFLEDKNGEPVIWLPFALYECPTKKECGDAEWGII
jgi:hypothetical protein